MQNSINIPKTEKAASIAPHGQTYPPAVILGESYGAYTSLNMAGVHVVGVSDTSHEFHRTYADETFRCPSYSYDEDGTAWMDSMRKIGASLQRAGRPVLFAASDRGLLAIARHYRALQENFVVACPAPQTIHTLINKVAFAKWMSAHNVPAPAHWCMPADDSADVDTLQSRFPCIVKPSFTFELEKLEGVKLYRARDAEELSKSVKICAGHNLDVVVQADLSQLSDMQWSLAGICDKPGHLANAVLARKLRQVSWGASTATETLRQDSRILALAKALCQALNMVGIFELEMRPDTSGDPAIIEVNPRIWSQVHLPSAAGINLLHHAYLAALDLPVPAQTHYIEGISWISRRRDFRVCLGLLRRGKLPVSSVLRSWMRARVLE